MRVTGCGVIRLRCNVSPSVQMTNRSEGRKSDATSVGNLSVSVADHLTRVRELRLLIGNTSSRETIR